MNPAKIRFIRKVTEVFRKIHLSPILWEPLKLQSRLVQLLAIWKQIANTGMKIYCAEAYGPIVASFFQIVH